jgi:multidrug resistance efflux pump
MLELILGGYALLIWLVFIKLKLLPWNIRSQVGAATGALVLVASLVLTINVVAPISSDVRAVNFVSEIVPRVQGTVTHVAVEGNTMVKKGDVLLRIDDTPYRLKVKELQAKLADATSSAKTLWQDHDAARSDVLAAQANLDLMSKRLSEAGELAGAGAGAQYDVESFDAEVKKAKAAVAAARSAEAKARIRLESVVGPDIASVAQIKAQLEAAQYDVESTVIRAPSDGYAVNVAVRPGNYLMTLPFRPAMSFVEREQRILAYYDQNELRFVKPGQKAEIALKTAPGKLVHAKVDSIVWANAQGQMMQSGAVPNTPAEVVQAPPPQKYAVKLTPVSHDGREPAQIPMGARGVGAIYTDKAEPMHLLRMVMVRAQSKLNYLVLKLH